MSYKTLEVELENGRVQPCGPEALPPKARALLTFVDSGAPSAALTCDELAGRWADLEKLPLAEANALADDIEGARSALPPLRPAWD